MARAILLTAQITCLNNRIENLYTSPILHLLRLEATNKLITKILYIKKIIKYKISRYLISRGNQVSRPRTSASPVSVHICLGCRRRLRSTREPQRSPLFSYTQPVKQKGGRNFSRLY